MSPKGCHSTRSEPPLPRAGGDGGPLAALEARVVRAVSAVHAGALQAEEDAGAGNGSKGAGNGSKGVDEPWEAPEDRRRAGAGAAIPLRARLQAAGVEVGEREAAALAARAGLDAGRVSLAALEAAASPPHTPSPESGGPAPRLRAVNNP